MDIEKIIPIKIRNSFVQEKTEEELRKIVNLDDIQDYFDEVAINVMSEISGAYYNERTKYILSHIEQITKDAFMYAYRMLIMYRNTDKKEAMRNLFEDELLIHMDKHGILQIDFPRIIIDDESNTFVVERKNEDNKCT